MKSLSDLIAKAILLNEKGELLMFRRSRTDAKRPGKLDLAGGGVDDGEGPDEAVIREIKEEAGLDLAIKELNMVYTSTTYYDTTSTIRFLYIGHIDSQQTITLSSEHEAYYWMKLEAVYEEYDHPTWIAGFKYLDDHGMLH